MIVIGVDSHKRTHTAAAADGNGRERNRAQNRLRWHLYELNAGNEPGPRSLDRDVVLRAIAARLEGVPGTIARIARELVCRIRDLTRAIDALEREIARVVREVAPTLLELPGRGPLSAAKLVGQVAGIGRFTLAAAFARHNGSAPLPAWSGYEHRRPERDMKPEAIRAPKRRISDEIYRRMRHDERLRATARATLAAAA